jgi:hypothetical protein
MPVASVIELAALRAGGEQQLPIAFFERVDLPRDHAAHRFRQVLRQVCN